MEYIFTLDQHIGNKAKAIVKPGQTVQKGEVIAEPDGLGAYLHTSVTGSVVSVTDQLIKIEGVEDFSESVKPIPESDSWLEDIKNAGIVGLGGAGFPTHVKLNTDISGGWVLINAVECEPLLEHNMEQLKASPEKIYRGLKYAMEITKASHGMLVIKEKNKAAAAGFLALVKKEDSIQVKEVKDLYPMGEERAVIRESLGQLLKTDELPFEAKAVVLNSETVYKITEAIEDRMPMIHKSLTVVGNLKNGKEPVVMKEVPIGTPISHLLETVGGVKEPIGEIIMGGPFTGKTASLESPVEKMTGGIIPSMEFIQDARPMGLLVCACGATEKRMRFIASQMGSPVVAVEKCKQAIEHKNALKCENPGECPGQAEKILSMRSKGAKTVLMGNCSDCSNTVMCVAPKLKMPVYHCTDHALRSVSHPIVRRLKEA
ncbi:proline reductase-associated electron transfer protein PrdC [Tindallia magadiensis]|uniref:Proline reductase-associated electron transfer protein PrdC n=1 Tax=Tindallia magadiensis TaxID=69895 RepID=A0A1I3D9E1_9FIRM|nr:proline reductase-associated electron transfer protein PrdC [Tindallia magadiensis]SFH83276.1 proline reductase-associated electron transfer protein PrdC [Tindallia magadiensis]